MRVSPLNPTAKPPNLLLRAGALSVITLAVIELVVAFLLAHPQLAGGSRFILDGLRSVYAREDWSVPQADPDIVQYDPELTYRLRPGSAPFANREFHTTLDINRAGLRDDEASLEGPELIVLGDSYAMGWGVQQHQSFPEVLEQRSGLRVLNAAMSSYGTARQVQLLDELDISRTRAVIIQYFQNDYTENRAYLDNSYELDITSQADFENHLDAFQQQTDYWPLDYTRAFFDRSSFFPELEGTTPQAVADTLLEVLESSEVLLDLPIILLQVDPWAALRFDIMDPVAELLTTDEYAELNGRLTLVRLDDVLKVEDFFVLDPHLRAGGHAKVAIAVEQALAAAAVSETPSAYKLTPPMPDRNPTTLDIYIERVMALKQERRTTPTDEELRTIALDIGLDEADLVAVEQAAEDHFVRGQGFLEHGRYSDAIAELEEAVALAPRRVERLHALARAHSGRWLERQDGSDRGRADRDRAETLARECLEIDPQHGPSFEVLNALDNTPVAELRPRADGRRPMLAVAVGVMFLVLGVAVVLRTSDNTEQPATVSSTAASTAASTASEPTNEPVSEPRELEIPVLLNPGSTNLELLLDTRHSRLKIYNNGKSFWTLNAILTQQGDTELDTLAARLELLDAEDAVLVQETIDLLNKAAPILRPGDAHALHLLRETGNDFRQARLVVTTVDQQPAAPSYAAAKPLEFDWQITQPADLDITVRERSSRFSEQVFSKDGSGYFDVVLEIENTSQRTLRRLKIEAQIMGPEERWTVTDPNHVVLTSGPALRPGETRLERVLVKVDERPESYWISVIDAQ